MGLFCGKTCKCKKRCKADLLSLGKDAVNGCKAACKTNTPPANGFDYLDTIPDPTRVMIESDPFIQEQFQEELIESDQAGINPMVLILFAIITVMLLMFLRKK